jgi:hypothetical protein
MMKPLMKEQIEDYFQKALALKLKQKKKPSSKSKNTSVTPVKKKKKRDDSRLLASSYRMPRPTTAIDLSNQKPISVMDLSSHSKELCSTKRGRSRNVTPDNSMNFI